MRGASERQRGQAEFRAAQAKGVVNATGNRVKGKGNQIAGAVTGDRTREMRGERRSLILFSDLELIVLAYRSCTE